MTLHEIIQDIHGLDAELAQLEKRYGLLSADFYHLYQQANSNRAAILSSRWATMKPNWHVRPAIAK